MENKETTKTNAATQTAVEEPTAQEVKNEEKSYEGDLKDLIGEGKYNISAPLFLMFAEYLKDSQDRKDIVNTINNMRIIVQAVEHTVYKEEQK